MKIKLVLIALLSLSLYISCSHKTTGTRVTGEISHPTDTVIRIGDNSVPVSGAGKFNFIPDLKSPAFYDVSYAGMYWAIYLEPGAKTRLNLTAGDFSSIEFAGDLKSSNNYLKESVRINNETNNFLNTNWVSLYALDETAFIPVIDSLKGLFLDPLSSLPAEDISADFVKLFTADVHFGFNRLIIQYPENHLMNTGKRVMLSESAMDYIDSAPYDSRGMTDLSNYKRFCQSWIYYKADLEADKNDVHKHYNLKKMDAVFQVLPEMFHDQYLKDYWLTEYLNEFIFLNGLTNSGSYIRDFNSSCTTREFADRITGYLKAEQDRRVDHQVKVYKTIDGFSLEAHIFSPAGRVKDEKQPAIVLFHGGGWQGGNPSWMFGNARHFRDLGLVAIAAQYRLTNRKDVTVFECLDDARDLIKWVRTNSDSLNIIMDSIAAYGWSAGGHLAVSAAIFNDSSPVNGVDSSPNAIILFSPAVSLPTNLSWIINALGYGADRGSINPVDHIRKGLPPVIILQGRDDTVTPLDAAQLFTDRMHESGNYCELVVYDEVGHLFTPNAMPDYNDPHPDPEVMQKASDKADEFLVKLGYVRKQ